MQVHQSGNVTDEAGNMTASFTVVLTAQPLRPVEVSVKTSDKSESSLDVEMLMFDGGNWNQEQVVGVRGVDDYVHDMDVDYSVTIASVAGSDAKFVGLKEVLEFTNLDDDEVGLQLLIDGNASTSELGEHTSFTVVLDSEPKAPVLFTVSSTDASEGVADTHLFALSAENWYTGKVITVTGQSDNEADGDVDYEVRVSPILSEDEEYVSLAAESVTIRNLDDPANKLHITETSPLSCWLSEADQEQVCEVSLAVDGWFEGAKELRLTAVTEAPREAKLEARDHSLQEKATYIVNGSNWEQGIHFTIRGMDDDLHDGDQSYKIVLSAEVARVGAGIFHVDSHSKNMPGSISCVTVDDEKAALDVMLPEERTTSESGKDFVFTVALSSRPTDVVSLTVVSSNVHEGKVASPVHLTIPPAEWMTPIKGHCGCGRPRSRRRHFVLGARVGLERGL
jgi:hypothetical protein